MTEQETKFLEMLSDAFPDMNIENFSDVDYHLDVVAAAIFIDAIGCGSELLSLHSRDDVVQNGADLDACVTVGVSCKLLNKGPDGAITFTKLGDDVCDIIKRDTFSGLAAQAILIAN